LLFTGRSIYQRWCLKEARRRPLNSSACGPPVRHREPHTSSRGPHVALLPHAPGTMAQRALPRGVGHWAALNAHSTRPCLWTAVSKQCLPCPRARPKEISYKTQDLSTDRLQPSAGTQTTWGFEGPRGLSGEVGKEDSASGQWEWAGFAMGSPGGIETRLPHFHCLLNKEATSAEATWEGPHPALTRARPVGRVWKNRSVTVFTTASFALTRGSTLGVQEAVL
jgi:hypothetical protein